jgi:hypothetical protein
MRTLAEHDPNHQTGAPACRTYPRSWALTRHIPCQTSYDHGSRRKFLMQAAAITPAKRQGDRATHAKAIMLSKGPADRATQRHAAHDDHPMTTARRPPRCCGPCRQTQTRGTATRRPNTRGQPIPSAGRPPAARIAPRRNGRATPSSPATPAPAASSLLAVAADPP